jgi:putative sterol carrier protein
VSELTPERAAERAQAGLQRIFRAEHTSTINLVIQFDLHSEGAVSFHGLVSEGTLRFEPGRAERPRVTMKMGAADFIDMLEGRLDTSDAWLSGRLKVGGNLIQALRLAKVFDFSRPR